MGYFLGSIIGIAIWGIAWGSATKIVIQNKGYDENWFWWGFFFGFIALIVACARPQNVSYTANNLQSTPNNYSNYSNTYNSNLNKAADKAYKDQILSSGGWKCICGRVNPHYTFTCTCGKSKNEVLSIQKKQKAELESSKKQTVDMDELSKVSAIKEYGSLLDAGIITPEEFEAKKKQLLGL